MLSVNNLIIVKNEKNIYLLLIIAVMAMACSKENNRESVLRTHVPATVSVVDEKLKFTDFSQADSVINMLLIKDNIARQAWYDSIGFLS